MPSARPIAELAAQIRAERAQIAAPAPRRAAEPAIAPQRDVPTGLPSDQPPSPTPATFASPRTPSSDRSPAAELPASSAS